MAAASDQKKRILDAATRLFAERGYDGVSTRLLGRAVGLNIATVNYHVGGKRALFDAVMQRLHTEEEERIGGYLQRFDAETVADADAVAAVLDGLIDALIDMIAEQPTRPRLYLRRWLAPRDELTSGEVEHSIAIYAPLRSLLARSQRDGWIRDDLDVDLFLRSFTWQLFGYFVTGPIDWERWYGDPARAESLAGFKAFMRHYARRMLGAAP